MDNSQLVIEIQKLIKNSIENYFKKPKPRNHHILDYLFPEERQISSVMTGLTTSMGTTFWEKLANFLAKDNGFRILYKQDKKLLQPSPFPQDSRSELDNLKSLRKSKEQKISMTECIERLRVVAKKINRNNLNYIDPPSGHGVDIYLIKDNIEYVFDLKATHPNRGDGSRFSDQLLDWYCYRLSREPLASIHTRIVIPFNPFLPKTWWESQGNKMYPLEENHDIWVENEFWDFCSGKINTWSLIKEAFIDLQEDKAFINKYKQKFRNYLDN